MTQPNQAKLSLPLDSPTVMVQVELVRISDRNCQHNGHYQPPPVKHFQFTMTPEPEKQSNQIQSEKSETADNTNQESSKP